MRYNAEFDTELNNNNLVLYVNDVKAELNDYDFITNEQVGVNIVSGDVLKIVPKQGYLIDPTHGNNAITDFITNNMLVFNVVEDRKSASVVYDGSLEDGYLTYQFSTITAPADTTDDDNPIDNVKKGVNNIYLLDVLTARKVMAKRFQQIKSSGDVKDYTESIIGLINIPFNIDDKYKNGEQKVMLADYDTELKGIELTTDTIIVDMGTITIPHLNNDFTDYENTTVKLYLPFCDDIDLNSNDTIGYNISINYWINCYNGETLINIFSSKTNSLIESRKVDLNVSVPFNRMGNVPTNNSFNQIKSIGYNGINTPYVEVKTIDNVLKDGLFTNPIIDEKILNGEVGFIEVENIQLNVNAMLHEKTEILNLLRQGVIIK